MHLYSFDPEKYSESSQTAQMDIFAKFSMIRFWKRLSDTKALSEWTEFQQDLTTVNDGLSALDAHL